MFFHKSYFYYIIKVVYYSLVTPSVVSNFLMWHMSIHVIRLAVAVSYVVHSLIHSTTMNVTNRRVYCIVFRGSGLDCSLET